MFDDADIFLIKTRSVRTQMNFITKNWNFKRKEKKKEKKRRKNIYYVYI